MPRKPEDSIAQKLAKESDKSINLEMSGSKEAKKEPEKSYV